MKILFRALRSGFFLFFIFVFPFCSCSARGTQSHVWGFPLADVHDFLKTQNYEFLDSVPVKAYDKILLVDARAAYYFAVHLSVAGRMEQANDFYALAATKSPEPWRSLAQYELTRVGTAEDRLLSIDKIVRDKKRKIKIAELSTEVLEEKKEILLFEAGRFSDVSVSPFEWVLSRSFSPELAASAGKLLEERVDAIDVADVADALDAARAPASWLRACLRVRLAVYEKEYQKAWDFARPLLEEIQKIGFIGQWPRALLSDFGLAALYGSSDVSADAALLRSLSQQASLLETESGTEIAHVFVFYAARLFQLKGSALEKKEHRDLFLTALEYAQTSREYDSSLWYHLDAGKGRSRNEMLFELKEKAALWKDPAWFSDIIEPLIVTLVREKDWKNIVFLSQWVGPYADSEIRIRLDYLSARSGLLSVEETKAAYLRAWEGDHNEFYYRLLSAEALGLPLESVEKAQLPQVAQLPEVAGLPGVARLAVPRRMPKAEIESGTGLAGFSLSEVHSILDGYIQWELAGELYGATQKWYPVLPSEVACWYAAKLTEEGFIADATRLVLAAVRPANVSVTHEDLEFLYPRPWLEEVRSSLTEAVSEPLLYALIRSESYFQNAVVSRSGAIGLTQLMPSTAGDIARKLKVTDYDLTDPKTNITFGAFYLDELIGRLNGNTMHALFSYNAGISRVRSWLRSSPDFEPDLFLETLPYAETREYGRKVLAAAAVYGYLYNQKTTGQAVRDLF